MAFDAFDSIVEAGTTIQSESGGADAEESSGSLSPSAVCTGTPLSTGPVEGVDVSAGAAGDGRGLSMSFSRSRVEWGREFQVSGQPLHPTCRGIDMGMKPEQSSADFEARGGRLGRGSSRRAGLRPNLVDLEQGVHLIIIVRKNGGGVGLQELAESGASRRHAKRSKTVTK